MSDSHSFFAPVDEAAPGILVVDDDPVLLTLLDTVFGRRGFRVWTAGAGDTAVSLYERHRDEIGVVLLDVCMPHLDGPGTLNALRQVNPCVQACFMSGFAGRYSIDDLHALGAARFFEKPFQIAALADDLWDLAQAASRQSA